MRKSTSIVKIVLALILPALMIACEKQADRPDVEMSVAKPRSFLSPSLAHEYHEFVVDVGDRVFFDFDKYNLNPEAKIQLAKWVAYLKKYPHHRLVIDGHCDERGTREYNLALSESRGNIVKDFLISQGIEDSRLRTISYGKDRPAVLGSSETAWAQNRRAVGVVQFD